MTRQIDRPAARGDTERAPSSVPPWRPSDDDLRLSRSLRGLSLQPATQNFPSAVGHAMGFLIAVASVPVLATGMLGQASPFIYALPIVVILVLRTYLGTAVRDALSPMRARAILNRVDQAAVFVFIGSACTVFAISAAHGRSAWAVPTALAAVASFALSGWLLGRARHTVSSSSFLSVLG